MMSTLFRPIKWSLQPEDYGFRWPVREFGGKLSKPVVVMWAVHEDLFIFVEPGIEVCVLDISLFNDDFVAKSHRYGEKDAECLGTNCRGEGVCVVDSKLLFEPLCYEACLVPGDVALSVMLPVEDEP